MRFGQKCTWAEPRCFISNFRSWQFFRSKSIKNKQPSTELFMNHNHRSDVREFWRDWLTAPRGIRIGWEELILTLEFWGSAGRTAAATALELIVMGTAAFPDDVTLCAAIWLPAWTLTGTWLVGKTGLCSDEAIFAKLNIADAPSWPLPFTALLVTIPPLITGFISCTTGFPLFKVLTSSWPLDILQLFTYKVCGSITAENIESRDMAQLGYDFIGSSKIIVTMVIRSISIFQVFSPLSTVVEQPIDNSAEVQTMPKEYYTNISTMVIPTSQ